LTERPFEGYLLSNFIAQTLAYPLTTVLRRLHCQDNKPGMLQYKYTGLLNGLKTIAKEEGVKGLFRGYLAFTTIVNYLNRIYFFLMIFLAILQYFVGFELEFGRSSRN